MVLDQMIPQSDIEQFNQYQNETQLDLYNFYKEKNKTSLSQLDINNLKEIKTVKTNHSRLSIYKILPLDNDKYVTCSADETIRIWSFDPSIPEKKLVGHTDKVRDIILLTNGKLASASFDGKVKIWNMENSVCEMTLQGHSNAYVVVELPKDMLISGGFDGIRVWNLKETNGLTYVRALNDIGVVYSIILVNNKHMAVSCGLNGEDIGIFNVFGSDSPIMVLKGHRDLVTDLLTVNEGQILLSSSFDYNVIMWNLQMGSRVRVFRGNTFAHKMILFKENIVAVSYANSEILFWNLFNGTCVKNVNTNQEYLFALAISGNGDLISCGSDSTIKLWSN